MSDSISYPQLSQAERLKLFDEASARQLARAQKQSLSGFVTPPRGRDWRREDLYTRGESYPGESGSAESD